MRGELILVDYSDATPSDSFAYSTDGNLIATSNSKAASVFENTSLGISFFRHRFSTKYYDEETGLYYYGYRFYSPEMGRWLNRDPMEEDGGHNVYGFCENNSLSRFDVLGMASVKVFARKQSTIWERLKGYDNFHFGEIHSAEEVPVEYALLDGAWGTFSDMHSVVFVDDCSDYIEVHPKMKIYPGLPKKGISGTRYYFSKHKVRGGRIDNTTGGGYVIPKGKPLEGSILAHERGHAQAFFELVLPRFRSSVESRFPGKLREEYTDEIRRLFRKAIEDTVNEHVEIVFTREYEWYQKNGYTITHPSSPGGFYEATF